jgi:hypothetical protein
MKRQLHDVLLCAAFFATILAAGPVLAAGDQPNKFDQAKKHDLEYSGTIEAINPKNGYLRVKNKEKDAIKLTPANDCMFFTKQKKGAASFADFKQRDDVSVLYREVDGKLICDAMWEPGSDPGQKEHQEEKQEK